jgi:hypothetical protein
MEAEIREINNFYYNPMKKEIQQIQLACKNI